jgi:hypothetical protein
LSINMLFSLEFFLPLPAMCSLADALRKSMIWILTPHKSILWTQYHYYPTKSMDQSYFWEADCNSPSHIPPPPKNTEFILLQQTRNRMIVYIKKNIWHKYLFKANQCRFICEENIVCKLYIGFEHMAGWSLHTSLLMFMSTVFCYLQSSNYDWMMKSMVEWLAG